MFTFARFKLYAINHFFLDVCITLDLTLNGFLNPSMFYSTIPTLSRLRLICVIKAFITKNVLDPER